MNISQPKLRGEKFDDDDDDDDNNNNNYYYYYYCYYKYLIRFNSNSNRPLHPVATSILQVTGRT